MFEFTTFCLANFLSIIGYLLFSDKCLPLADNGGYPTCNNYQTQIFDFVIVGAGPAGCTLANRLSKNPKVKVLLIEAGNYPSFLSEMPAGFIFLQRSEFDYNFTMQQPNMFRAYKNGVGRIAQGRGLGGGSVINAMIDLRGVRYDYNRWADVTHDPEWAFDKLTPYFDKVSDMVQTTNYTATRLARVNLALAALELGYSVNDPNDIMGYHEVPIMVHELTRNSIARAYLKPIAKRANLCVIIGKTVSKIIIDPRTKGATGVEVQDANGPVYITAIREVIISAGAINSAKVLMLSGIGPRQHLSSLGIDVIQNLPVGRLRDHLYVPLFAQIPSVFGFSTLEEYVEAYCAIGCPMENIDITNFVGLINTNGDETHPNVEIIHAEYPAADKVFFPYAFNVMGYSDEIGRQLYSANKFSGILTFAIANLHPKSQGTVLLNSSDPHSNPIILPNYLNDPEDSKVLIDAILNIVIPMLDTLPFELSKLIRFPLPECDSIPLSGDYYKSRDYWACYMRHLGTSGLHPLATCRMGSVRTSSVLDSRLRVWGVQKLRVVDSSVFPFTISGHPTVPVTMLSEKAADIILKDNGLG